MLHKSFSTAIKADTGADAGAGVFEALASTWDVDSVGDLVVPGAFADSLAEWEASGQPIPVIWSHQHDDPFAHIGYVLDAEERDQGLWVKAQLDIDPEAENAHARQAYRLLKAGRVTSMSFAFDIDDAEPAGNGVTLLKKLKLYEVGPTLIPANPAAELLTVKHHTNAAGVKAGRVLSAKNETALRDIRDQLATAAAGIDDVLTAVDQTAVNNHTTEDTPGVDSSADSSSANGSSATKTCHTRHEQSPESVRLLTELDLLT